MEYQNARHILPPELIERIQQYFQGGYLYIPASGPAKSASHQTAYQTELEKRNGRIYQKYLRGWSSRRLAEHYSLSVSSIRRILQNQRKDAQAMEKSIIQVLRFWGLEELGILQREENVWEIDGKYMLKAYTDLSSLERNIRILTILHKNGIPTAQVIPVSPEYPWVSRENRFYLLTTKLEGSHYDGAVTESIARSMGQTLAALHLAFQSCQNQLTLWDNSLLQELSGWIFAQLDADGWKLLPKALFDEVYSALAALYPRLNVQLIHRDVHFGNFLFSGETFTGYIDFDLSQKNIRIFDLCYFLAGLLARETGAQMGLPWSRIVRETVDAYDRINPLTSEEKSAIPLVMQAIELLFAGYFLSIQDTICAADAIRVLHRIREELAQ